MDRWAQRTSTQPDLWASCMEAELYQILHRQLPGEVRRSLTTGSIGRDSAPPCSDVFITAVECWARRQARGGRASEGRAWPFGAAGLHHRLGGSSGGPLPVSSACGHGVARAPAGPGERTATVRLPASLRPPAPGQRAIGHRSDLPALPRGGADGEEATRPATRGRDQGADPRGSECERSHEAIRGNADAADRPTVVGRPLPASD